MCADLFSGILPAAHKGDLAEVQRYLRCQCDTCITSCPSVALCCSKGLTALLVAAKAGRAAVVEALLGAHADIEAAMQGTGETALMLAAGQCHPEVVRVLLAAGAKVFSRDTKGGRLLGCCIAMRLGMRGGPGGCFCIRLTG
jgi:hypothetical protein